MADDSFSTEVAAEIAALKKAGDALAVAAGRVVSEYDGVHRLRLALSEWYQVRANEGGRGDSK